MSFLENLFGKGERVDQIDRYSPQQNQLQQDILSGAQGQLPGGFDFLSQILSGDPSKMAEFQAPARRSFEENTLPSIAERFTGMGAQKSSAFGQQLGQAGAGLEENLAAQRGGMQSNALSQLMALLGQGMTPGFENVFRPATHGFLGGLGQGSSGGLGQVGGMTSILKLLPLLGIL